MFSFHHPCTEEHTRSTFLASTWIHSLAIVSTAASLQSQVILEEDLQNYSVHLSNLMHCPEHQHVETGGLLECVKKSQKATLEEIDLLVLIRKLAGNRIL